MSKKLKNCPFCGGDSEIETEEYGGSAKWVSTIYCVEGCITMSDIYGPIKEAIKRWNTRYKGDN